MGEGESSEEIGAASIFVTVNALYRIWRMFTEGARFIDWAILIVDFLVLAVIVWLDAPERFHKRKVRKALKIVKDIMAEGQSFVTSAPWISGNPTDDRAAQWVKDVMEWIKNTHTSLLKLSIPAMMAFEQRALEPDVNFGGMTRQSRANDHFRELLHRLRSVQNIMEKADVYF
jgi:hypothetical protein